MKKLLYFLVLFFAPFFLLAQETITTTFHFKNKVTSENVSGIDVNAYKIEEVSPGTTGTYGKEQFEIKEGDYLIGASENNNNYQPFYRQVFVNKPGELNYILTPKIEKFNLNIKIFNTDQLPIDSVKVIPLIEGQDWKWKYTRKKGDIDFLQLPTENCFKLKFIHHQYKPQERCYCNFEDKHVDTIKIDLERSHFSKKIYLVDEKSKAPITNVNISLPDYESKIPPKVTNSYGMVKFDFVEKGYQRIKIGGIKGYKPYPGFKFIMVSDDEKHQESIIKLSPVDPPKYIILKGRITDMHDIPLPDAETNIILSEIKHKIVLDRNGNFSEKIELDKMGTRHEFLIEINRPDFFPLRLKNQSISLYDFETKEKIIHGLKLKREYDYYTLTIDKIRSKIDGPISVIFNETHNNIAASEKGTKVKIKAIKDKTEIKVRGPVNFKNVLIIITRNNKERCRLISTNNKDKIAATIWKVNKKCKKL